MDATVYLSYLFHQCDDDTFNFSMRGLLRLASWLDSYTESAIAAMAGVRFLIFMGVSELRVERNTYAPDLLGDQEEFIAGDERAACIPKLQRVQDEATSVKIRERECNDQVRVNMEKVAALYKGCCCLFVGFVGRKDPDMG
ncbi:hypothetical protein Tco_1311770 [Tanacetum coccineum]